ncbi:MAG TPA: amidohydrolase family protein [Thermoleophilaceae bacterium]
MAIVDTQTHWFSPTLLDAYVAADSYPRCQKKGDDYLFELAPGQFFPLSKTFTDVDDQMETLATHGITTILSSSASFGDVDAMAAPMALEVAHALNEERAALQREHPGRFFGLATVPWQDGPAALEAVERAAELGLPGVLIHSNIAGSPVDAEHCLPVYERIAALGLVLSIHPARSVAEPALRDYGLEYLVGFMFDTSIAALRLVLSGVMAANPDLKVVHPHCGATLPYLAGRIDASHSQPYSLGAPLEVPPSVQLGRFYTDTVAQSADTIAFAERFYGQSHLIFGSDYPFMPPARELDFARASVADVDAVLAGNATALFGLSTDGA